MLPAKQSTANPGERSVAFTHKGTDVLLNDLGLVNMTLMWRSEGSPSGKEPAEWRRRDDAATFIRDLASSLNMGQAHVLKTSRGKGGATWAHWQIAMAYAKHLSTEFHRRVNEAFREWSEEQADPALKVERAVTAYQRRGKDMEWIERRFQGIVARKALTSTMADHNCKVNGPNDNPFAEATRAISLAVLGKTPREIREEKGLGKSARTRDHLDADNLIATAFVESQSRKLMKATAADGNVECVDVCRRVARAARVALDMIATPAEASS